MSRRPPVWAMASRTSAATASGRPWRITPSRAIPATRPRSVRPELRGDGERAEERLEDRALRPEFGAHPAHRLDLLPQHAARHVQPPDPAPVRGALDRAPDQPGRPALTRRRRDLGAVILGR